jgi:hypothetical protein
MLKSKYYMALIGPVRGRPLRRESPLKNGATLVGLPVLWSICATILIAGPWLRPGYLFGTDWPGPRRFDFPSVLSSSAPLEAILAGVSRIASGEVTGKALVIAIVFAAALTAFRAAPADSFLPRAVASTVYVFNPFVFGRLHYGQVFLLAGYALMPWAASRLRQLMVTPSVNAALMFALSGAVLGIISTHLFFVTGVLAAVVAITYLVAVPHRLAYARQVGPMLLIAAAATLIASSYWLVPLLVGHGPTATAISRIGHGDLAAFAVVPDKHLGLLPNVLGLYGFWAENTGRFASMKEFVPFWPLILAGLLGVCGIGAVATLTRGDKTLKPWVVGLLVAAAVAVALEVGVSHPLTRGLVTWLDVNFPLYRGMRDAGKWAALLALVYAQLVGLGVATILAWVRSIRTSSIRREWLVSAAAAIVLAAPLYYGNGLFYGMHREIEPSQYPSGWYAADQVLISDPHPGRTLFLPWHEYMAYTFVRNQNRVVASPAPTFFSVPIVVSKDPELRGISAPRDLDQVVVSDLVKTGATARWAQTLAGLGIKYLLLAREGDWETYDYLNDQPGLTKINDLGSIVLYRNNLAT